jgi:hypothetical protein
MRRIAIHLALARPLASHGGASIAIACSPADQPNAAPRLREAGPDSLPQAALAGREWDRIWRHYTGLRSSGGFQPEPGANDDTHIP